jgi:hypothetical protein
VSPREMLNALEGGVRVVGGSSMGALRASELDAYGMEGVGKIYRWYRDKVINSDDEVALIFHPETYRALSEPLVNIRATLGLLHSRSMVTSEERDTLIRAAKDTPFQLRSHMRVVQAGIAFGLDKNGAARLLKLLDGNRVDQKREDASEVLRKLKEILEQH